MRSMLFLFREFLSSLALNRFLHFTYGVQVTISLLVLGIFLVLMLGAAVIWNRVGNNLLIHAYMSSTMTETGILQLKNELEQMDHVHDVEYRSQSDALAIWEAKNPHMDLGILESDDILPASLIIRATHPRYIQGLAEQIKSMPGVEELRYGSEMVQNFLKVMMILISIGAVTILLLLVFTASSISNIIGMSIYARRTEIRIMQLVGATWWFIRWPFLFEGVFFGTVGAIVASLIIWALLLMMSEALKLSELTLALPYFGLNTGGIFVVLALLLLSLGGLVGFFGSLRTVNTFLGRETEVNLDALRVRQLTR
ncbi:hypothetical protein JW859_12820 [bacterium]|nr:hypothetical protein [bacterium]